MDHPPTPPGPRTRAQAARSSASSPIVAPPHRSAIPRAFSGSPTPASMGYYNPLHDDVGNPDDANPFHVDSEDEDEQSFPVLLSNLAGIDATAAATADVVGTAGLAGATTGDVTAGIETAAATDPTDATVPSDLAVPPAVNAAIVAAVVSALESSLAANLTPINTRLTRMQAEILSNHGHVTKRLLPALETKLTALPGMLDSKTMVLEAKGQSLLEKITALEGMVTHKVREKNATLESAVEFATKKYKPWIAALESHGLGLRQLPAEPPPPTRRQLRCQRRLRTRRPHPKRLPDVRAIARGTTFPRTMRPST